MTIQELKEKYGEERTEVFLYSFYDIPMTELISIILKYIPPNELERMINAFP